MTTRSKTHKATFAPNKASVRPDARGEKPTLCNITGRMDASKRGKSASVHYGFSQKSNKSCYLLKRFGKEKNLIFQGLPGTKKGDFEGRR
jgi:hypothetical protein